MSNNIDNTFALMGNVLDGHNGENLYSYLSKFNQLNVGYVASAKSAREAVPKIFRKTGLYLTYYIDSKPTTEIFIGDKTAAGTEETWIADNNWEFSDGIGQVDANSISLNQLSQEVLDLIGKNKKVNITNYPDGEDLTQVDICGGNSKNEVNVLKFADKEYNPATFSGLGRKYLRKNIVEVEQEDGTVKTINLLTQDMINEPNTRYIIQYSYDTNNINIDIPQNSIIEFKEGGDIIGTLNLCNKDILITGGKVHTKFNIGLKEDILNKEYNDSWFAKNYNININNIILIGSEDKNYRADILKLDDNYNLESANTAITLNGIIGVNINNVNIINYEVGIKYTTSGKYRQNVCRVNIGNCVIKYCYQGIVTIAKSNEFTDYGDTTINNVEIFASTSPININNQDGIVITSCTLYTSNIGKAILINLVNNLNAIVSNNQIFGGKIGAYISGERSNHNTITNNGFMNIGRDLTLESISNSYCILIDKYNNDLTIVGNTFAPLYTKRYIKIKDSKINSITLQGNTYTPTSERLGVNTSFDWIFNIYSPYEVENSSIHIYNVETIKIKNGNNGIYDLQYTIDETYTKPIDYYISKRKDTIKSIYNNDFVIRLDYSNIKDRIGTSIDKTIYLCFNNTVKELNINANSTLIQIFNSISDTIKQTLDSCYNDNENGYFYIRSLGGFTIYNFTSDAGRYSTKLIQGGIQPDLVNVPNKYLKAISNVRNIDFGHIGDDRYLKISNTDYINEERDVKLKITSKNTTGDNIIPCLIDIKINNTSSIVNKIYNIITNKIFGEDITCTPDGVITIPKNKNGGFEFIEKDSINTSFIQTTFDDINKLYTNIFSYDRLIRHSTTIANEPAPDSGRYFYVYDKFYPIYYYNGKWYKYDGASYDVLISGSTENRPSADKIYRGFCYFDVSINKPIWWNGTQWVESYVSTSSSGNTASRPSNPTIGYQYFDTDLNKPIYWTGSKWVDATGADVDTE